MANAQVILITGAAGFLGSAITVDLARDHRVAAVDCREPSADLRRDTAGTLWHKADIADASAVHAAFVKTREMLGSVDVVLHFAAFYHFGADWRAEYERTNLQGTANVLRAAAEHGSKRMIFASSVAAMLPPPEGGVLTEKTPAADYIPYARSKSLGEQMVRAASDRLPSIVLRIAGAFSDWSELPPLTSLIGRCAGRGPASRLVPGRGTTGMPYIHRSDLVRMVRSCIARHATLARDEVFLASPMGAVLHDELFAAIRRECGDVSPRPIFIPPGIARIGLRVSRALGCIIGQTPYEHPWMLQFVDRAWIADSSTTCGKLNWRCTEGMGILERIPVILENFRRDRRAWDDRNRRRNRREYVYASDADGDQ
jgi:nucleoside-diphosphate-sugar epimerase